jgi:rhodanese-related sulfurtransferase
VVVATFLVLFVAYKYIQRWRILRELRINRITPLDLQGMLDKSRDTVTIVDLRHPSEVERDAFKIPGALVLRPEDLRSRAREIPQGQEIILYCT